MTKSQEQMHLENEHRLTRLEVMQYVQGGGLAAILVDLYHISIPMSPGAIAGYILIPFAAVVLTLHTWKRG